MKKIFYMLAIMTLAVSLKISAADGELSGPFNTSKANKLFNQLTETAIAYANATNDLDDSKMFLLTGKIMNLQSKLEDLVPREKIIKAMSEHFSHESEFPEFINNLASDDEMETDYNGEPEEKVDAYS